MLRIPRNLLLLAAAALMTASIASAQAAGLSYDSKEGLIAPTAPDGPGIEIPAGWPGRKRLRSGRGGPCPRPLREEALERRLLGGILE